MKKTIFYVLASALIVSAGGFTAYKKLEKPAYNYTEAKKTTIVREVSATGKVKAAQSVNLSFEKSGKVAGVYIKVGSKVSLGQYLARLENGETNAQLLQAQANLAAEKAKLDEMKKGTRAEEITIAETDLENAKTKAAADLKEDYGAAVNAANSAVIKAKNILLALTDLQFKYFTGNNQDSVNISEAKKAAVKSLLGVDNGGTLSAEELSKLEGGAYVTVQKAVADLIDSDIDRALSETADALEDAQAAINSIKVLNSFTSTEKTNLAADKITIAGEIITISAKEQAIAVQKITNTNNIAAAQSALDLKKSGFSTEQIAAEEARVRSAEANVKNYQALLAKTIITAPISGIVAKQDAKAGEIVSANTTLVSLISTNKYEIEANVPEADIAKIKVGNTADVTLDAYGNDVRFNVKITAIDPAETVIEGVSTYKTTFQFTAEDGRIKSGMTANLDILTDKKENVIAIPSRAVITKGADKIVTVLGNNILKEVKVTLGLRGSDGNVEIVSGISEGDKVVTK